MKRRVVLCLLTLVMIVSQIAMFGTSVSAASPNPIPLYLDPRAVKAATTDSLIDAFIVCFGGGDSLAASVNAKANISDITALNWFDSRGSYRTWTDPKPHTSTNEGGQDCDQLNSSKGGGLKTLLSAVGLDVSKPVDVFCTLYGLVSPNNPDVNRLVSAGFKVNAGCDPGSVADPSKTLFFDNGRVPAPPDYNTTLSRIKANYKALFANGMQDPVEHYVAAASFLTNSNICKMQAQGNKDTPGSPGTPDPTTPATVVGGGHTILQVVDSTGGNTAVFYSNASGGDPLGFGYTAAPNNSGVLYISSCDSQAKQIIDIMTKNAQAYADWVKANQIDSCAVYTTKASITAPNTPTTIGAACDAGSQNSDPTFCPTTYSKDVAQEKACEHGQLVTTAITAGQTPPADTNGTSTCSSSIGGMGWIICPIVNFMASALDQVYNNFIAKYFLTIDSTIYAVNSPTYKAWETFRNYANIAFIVAFLWIIYSQITSVGVSNYGIKKMLPKLIIAAILVNISFFVCQLAVDLSNLIGQGVTGLFGSINVGGAQHTPSASTLSGDILQGTIAAIAGAILLLLALLLGILIPALIAVLMIAFILIAREVLIILLIVISPLAFVAYLLPNTEKLFQKWWSTFSKLLLVFPVISLVVGGGKLAATVLLSLSQNPDGGDSSSTGIGTYVFQIAAIGAMTLPFFIVPSLLKKSLEAAGTIGAKMRGMGDKATGKVGKKASSKAKERWQNSSFSRGKAIRDQEKKRFKSQKFSERMANGGTFNPRAIAARGGIGGFAFTAAGRSAKAAQAASAQATVSKATNEAIQAEEIKLSSVPVEGADGLMDRLGKGSVEEQSAVIRRIAAVGGDGHIQKVFDHLMTSTDPKTKDVQQLVSGALSGRKPAGVSGAQLGALQTGTLRGDSRKDSSGNPIKDAAGNEIPTGYADSLANRVKQQKMGAKDYASMSPDDLARLAQLSQSGKLSAADLTHIEAQFAAIKSDQTLQGSMTGEKEKLFENIRGRSAPQNADGSARTLTTITPPSP